jgi:putative endopeptidase
MIGAAAAALVACNAAVEAPADSGDVPAIDEAVTTAGAELEVESTYAGDCTGVEGEAPIINAVDRDDWSSAGLDLGAMDKRFEAGDDFFCHVNGAWYNNFEMPDDKTRYGSFTLLRDKSEARV